MYQHIVVESEAKIYRKNCQLFIETDYAHHVPIEDVATLVLDNRKSTITTFCLDSLVQNGTAVFICNEKRLPSGILLPFAANSRQLKMIRLQMEQTKPRKKQLWKQIVQQKIRNQGKCLELCHKDNTVERFVDKVKSGDPDNIEAVAAAVYFKNLFGRDFIRHEESLCNGMLDYGYAILRGSMARYLAMYGFEPSLGLFHHSELNNFNLADDMIEPFRPLVDLYAYYHADGARKELSPTMRHELVQLVSCDILSGREVHAVHYAMERTVQSLARAFSKREESLLLPELLPLQSHRYE